jgi:N-acetylneuraminic acid mutarotase
MVAFDGHLYVVGGVGRTDRTLVYGPEADRWTTGAAMPNGRDHLRAAAWRGEIWAIGGRTGRPTTHVDIYDPRRDQWRRGPDLPVPMSAMAVGVIEDALYVVGGEDPALIGGHVIREHFVLRRGARRWVAQRRPLLAVHGSGFAVYQDEFIVAGGATRAGLWSTISWTNVAQMFRPGGFPKQIATP